MIESNINEITKLIKGYKNIIVDDDRKCEDALQIKNNRESKVLLKMYEHELTRWQELKEYIEDGKEKHSKDVIYNENIFYIGTDELLHDRKEV